MSRPLSLPDGWKHPGPRGFRARRACALAVALAVVSLAVAGCFPKRGAYPIETFTEMHYSQSYRAQEPPRLSGAPGAEPFLALGVERVLDVPEKRVRAYNELTGAELFRVNCAVCHGENGDGDSPMTPFLTALDSYYASTNGAPYNPPPNLLETRERLDENAVFSIVSNGIFVMPRFSGLLSEEERWDIVRYMFDIENGLGK